MGLSPSAFSQKMDHQKCKKVDWQGPPPSAFSQKSQDQRGPPQLFTLAPHHPHQNVSEGRHPRHLEQKRKMSTARGAPPSASSQKWTTKNVKKSTGKGPPPSAFSQTWTTKNVKISTCKGPPPSAFSQKSPDQRGPPQLLNLSPNQDQIRTKSLRSKRVG